MIDRSDLPPVFVPVFQAELDTISCSSVSTEEIWTATANHAEAPQTHH